MFLSPLDVSKLKWAPGKTPKHWRQKLVFMIMTPGAGSRKSLWFILTRVRRKTNRALFMLRWTTPSWNERKTGKKRERSTYRICSHMCKELSLVLISLQWSLNDQHVNTIMRATECQTIFLDLRRFTLRRFMLELGSSGLVKQMTKISPRKFFWSILYYCHKQQHLLSRTEWYHE